LQIQQGQFGIKLHFLGAAHPVPGVEAGADLLAALIGAAHAGLGPLRQGLQVGDLAADGAMGLLGRLHVGHDLGLAGIELRQAHGGVFALELLRALALGQGVELGADLLELCRQGAQAFALVLALLFSLSMLSRRERVSVRNFWSACWLAVGVSDLPRASSARCTVARWGRSCARVLGVQKVMSKQSSGSRVAEAL
jgi:hypothetical protein